MKRHLPRCPAHLTPSAAREWRRVVGVLTGMGVLTAIDARRARRLLPGLWPLGRGGGAAAESSLLYRTPGGHVQQSPLLGIIHKQLELMGRYMVELGMTPAARSRVSGSLAAAPPMYRAIRDLTDGELEAIVFSAGRDGTNLRISPDEAH